MDARIYYYIVQCIYIHALCLASRRHPTLPPCPPLFFCLSLCLFCLFLAYSVMSVFFFCPVILPARTILACLLALFSPLHRHRRFPRSIPRCPDISLLFLHLSLFIYLLGVSAAGEKQETSARPPRTMIGLGNPVYPSGLCFFGPLQRPSDIRQLNNSPAGFIHVIGAILQYGRSYGLLSMPSKLPVGRVLATGEAI